MGLVGGAKLVGERRALERRGQGVDTSANLGEIRLVELARTALQEVGVALGEEVVQNYPRPRTQKTSSS